MDINQLPEELRALLNTETCPSCGEPINFVHHGGKTSLRAARQQMIEMHARLEHP